MSARSVRHYYLHLAIPGWQGRVEEHFPMELRDALTHATVLALDPAVVIAAMTNLVGHAQITAALIPQLEEFRAPRKALASAPSRAPLRAVVGVPLRDRQEARRAARAARAGRAGRKKAPTQ